MESSNHHPARSRWLRDQLKCARSQRVRKSMLHAEESDHDERILRSHLHMHLDKMPCQPTETAKRSEGQGRYLVRLVKTHEI